MARPAGLVGAVGLGYHAIDMRVRRVVLLVAIYLVLDFANPMMPGAVQLIDGSLQTVAGYQARTAGEVCPQAAALPRRWSPVLPPRPTIVPTVRIASAPPFVPMPCRAALEAASLPASSPDDD